MVRRSLVVLLLALLACTASADGPKTAGGFGTAEEEIHKAKPTKAAPGASGVQPRNVKGVQTKPGATRGTVAQRPPIPVPADGKIITEVCLTDDDLLGVIKRAAAGLARSVSSGSATETAPKNEAAASDGQAKFEIGFGLKDIADALQGVRAVRFLVIRFDGAQTAEHLAREFDGQMDSDRWRRILSDVGLFGGSAAFYMDTKDGDMMGFCYNADSNTMYAARVVGSIDLAKLTGFLSFATK